MSERTTNDWGIIGRRLVAVLGCALVTAVHVGSHSLVLMVCDDRPERSVEIEIKQLTNMVETYYLASSPRSLPGGLDDLAEGANKLTEEVPKDPWGNDYIYVYSRLDQRRGFVVFSMGPDGVAGTDDDIFGEGQ